MYLVLFYDFSQKIDFNFGPYNHRITKPERLWYFHWQRAQVMFVVGDHHLVGEPRSNEIDGMRYGFAIDQSRYKVAITSL